MGYRATSSVLLAIAAFEVVAATPAFEEFRASHGVSYDNLLEEAYREGVFAANVAALEAIGGRVSSVGALRSAASPFTLSLAAAGRWADRTAAELAALRGVGGLVVEPLEDAGVTPGALDASPDSAAGGVTPASAAAVAAGVVPPSRLRGLADASSADASPLASPSASAPASSSSSAGALPPASSSSSSSSAAAAGGSSWLGGLFVWPWAPSASPRPAPSSSPSPAASPLPPAPVPAGLPPSVDWSLLPALAGSAWPVKEQGACGACFAFSTAGALEAAAAARDAAAAAAAAGAPPPGAPPAAAGGGAPAAASAPAGGAPPPPPPPYDLSEQEVLSCSGSSCAGGGIRQTWRYIAAAGGLCPDAAMPYTGVAPPAGAAAAAACAAPCGRAARAATNVTGYRNIARSDEGALLAALAAGPVVVAIAGDAPVFLYYAGGVLDAAAACGTTLNHAVVAVGYGVDAATGLPYFKVRNSWGASWGEGGYARLARGGPGYGAAGVCGVLADPTVPVLAPYDAAAAAGSRARGRA